MRNVGGRQSANPLKRLKIVPNFHSHHTWYVIRVVQRSCHERNVGSSITIGRRPQLLVLPGQSPLHPQNACNSREAERAHDQHSHKIPRLVALREEERRDKVAEEREDVAEGNASSTLLRGATKGDSDPGCQQRVR